MSEEETRDREPEAQSADGPPPPSPESPAAGTSAEDWRDKYLRALAELDNYRKRMEREREQTRLYAVEALVRDLLPVLDSLELALAADGGAEAIRAGVELARQEALRVLADRGLAPIEALGRLFDPREHEAAGTVFDPTRPEGTVVTELRRGYRLRDRVVRPARVQIAVSPTDQKETD
jgi:molecular chaperone GrpE